MRAIVVMFDSLNRLFLPPYTPETQVVANNFSRLADHTVTFDRCYGGSMPCMPARRELHTGRYSFLHRSWGPLEPFDDSVPAMLASAGVYTHLTTDHMHYWEDGGATYHPRYSTFNLIRGQQGDPWKGIVADPRVDDDLRVRRAGTWRQDQITRQYMEDLADHPQVLTFDAGLEFIHANRDADSWMLQIETFDPHEPFFSNPELHELYPDDYTGPEYEWPDYMQVIDDEATVKHVRNRYAALISLCDRSLGRVLDAMDELDLWNDTMLIVCTDHGFLLGEQGWWGKLSQPWYEETIHTPLFVWDPRSGLMGERRATLVQTIDLGPTLLDYFNVELTADMQGVPLRDAIARDEPTRQYALFGSFGGHVSITDGRYVYMRCCVTSENTPLFEHTLMPTHMRGRFSADELKQAELVQPFGFTKGMPLLRTPGHTMTDTYRFGTLLFDLQTDPGQVNPLVDDTVETRMATALVHLMRASDSPPSQFERLGLPHTGVVRPEHLLCRVQHEQAVRGRQPPPALESFPTGRYGIHQTIEELMSRVATAEVLRKYLPRLTSGPFTAIASPVSLYRAAVATDGLIPWSTVQSIAEELAMLDGTEDMRLRL